MRPSDQEDLLFQRLNSPQLSAKGHLRALDVVAPSAMAEVSAIGLDTNVLKALRHDPTFADSLFITVQATQTTLIAPGQCVVEYWNNHKVFASEEWNVFRNSLTQITRHLDSTGVDEHNQRTIGQIRDLVDELTVDLEESRAPGYLNKSRQLMSQLLETATVPLVSRARLATLADVRLASKTPPGWADGKTKSAALGDFFGWCDFMLGALCVTDPRDRKKFVYVTDDSKPDWRTGTAGHPALIAEFEWICGGDLSILSLADLRGLLAADARSNGSASNLDDSAAPSRQR